MGNVPGIGTSPLLTPLYEPPKQKQKPHPPEKNVPSRSQKGAAGVSMPTKAKVVVRNQGDAGMTSAPPSGLRVGPNMHGNWKPSGMEVLDQIQSEIRKAQKLRDKIVGPIRGYSLEEKNKMVASLDDYLSKMHQALQTQQQYVHQQYARNAADVTNPGIIDLEKIATSLYQGLGIQSVAHLARHPLGYKGSEQAAIDAANQMNSGKAVLNAVTGYRSIMDIGSHPVAGTFALAGILPFFKPLRIAGALSEGTGVAIRGAEEGGRISSGLRAGRDAWTTDRGLIRPAFRAGKSLLPKERKLAASQGRAELFALLDHKFAAPVAQSLKRTWDQAIKATVRSGAAESVDEAVGRLASATPDEIPGIEIMRAAGEDGDFLAQIERFHGDSWQGPGGKAEKNFTAKMNGQKRGLGKHQNKRFMSKKGHPVVGYISPEEWVRRVLSVIKDASERAAWAKWYHEFEPTFRAVFGEHADAIMRAFAVSQANDSPAGGLMAVLRIYDDIARGIPVTDKSYSVVGGSIRDALKDLPIEKGVAAKLSDFIDALRLQNERAWMGYKKEGGMPSPADVHGARDHGFVDPKSLGYLEKEHGINVSHLRLDVMEKKLVRLRNAKRGKKSKLTEEEWAAKNAADIAKQKKNIVEFKKKNKELILEGRKSGLKIDNPSGSPSGNRYERVSEWYGEIADYLNGMDNGVGFDGRNDWTPLEAQALGWATIQKFHGVDPEDFTYVFNANSRTIAAQGASAADLEELVRSENSWPLASGNGWVRAVMSPEASSRIVQRLADTHGEARAMWLSNKSMSKTHLLRVSGQLSSDAKAALGKAGFSDFYDMGSESVVRASGKIDKVALSRAIEEHELDVTFNGKVQEDVRYAESGDADNGRSVGAARGGGPVDLGHGLEGERTVAGSGHAAALADRERSWLRVRRGGTGLVRFTELDPSRDLRVWQDAIARNSVPVSLSQHSAKELAKHRLFLSEDGEVGALVTAEGDVRNVFRNPDGIKGASQDAIVIAKRVGGKTLDNYDWPKLTRSYRKAKFGVVGRMKFSDEYAPPGWDYEKYGRPDIVFQARGAKDLGKDAPYYTDYDAAQADALAAAEAAPPPKVPDTTEPLFQREGGGAIKGYIQIVKHPDGRVQDGLAARIGLTKKADVTTAIHELGHFLAYFGLSSKAKSVVEGWVGKRFEEWGVPEHEMFARGFEAYFAYGKAPNTLKAEFEKLAPVFREMYPNYHDLPELTPEMEKVFAQLLGHRDGLPAAVYFMMRNKVVASVIARSHGPARSEEEARQHVRDVNEQLRQQGHGIKESEITNVEPGQMPEEFGGELGHRIRGHIAGRPGFVDPEEWNSLGHYGQIGAKLDLPSQRVAREQQLEGYSRQRRQRVAKGSDAFGAAGGGLAGHYAAKGKLAGEFDKVSTSALDLSTDEANHLADWIEEHPKLKNMFFARRRATDALLKLSRGETLQANEERLLGSIFGRMQKDKSFRAAWHQASWGERALELVNVPRALQSMLDFSAFLRQGLVSAVHNPRAWGRQIPGSFKAAGSEASYEEWMASITEMDSHALMVAGEKDDRISFTGANEQIGQREEGYQSALAERIWGVGHLVRMSDRSYTGFLNGNRAAAADALYLKAARAGWDLSDEAVRGSINRFVNSATGRGSLGVFESHAATLNALLFSPRLLWSRLNFLNPIWYAMLHPFVRRQALTAMFRLIGLTVGVLELAHLGGAKVVLDPTNADFAKVKIGNTRIDFLGGFQQPVRVASQLYENRITSSTTGISEDLSGKGVFGLSRGDILWRFFESKFSPTASMADTAIQGQDPHSHEPLDWKSFQAYKTTILSHMYPLIIVDIWNLPTDLMYLAPLPVVGVGVNTYGPGETKAAKAQKEWIKTTEETLGRKIPPAILEIRATKTRYEDLQKTEVTGETPEEREAQRAQILVGILLEKYPTYSAYQSRIDSAIETDPSAVIREIEKMLGWDMLSEITRQVNEYKNAQKAHG